MKQCVISIVNYFLISDLDMDEKYFVYKFLAALSQTSIFLGFFMIPTPPHIYLPSVLRGLDNFHSWT